MAREIPKAPSVHTTSYNNFKGVDFTNDQTNIWRRRSPSGVNMLPDASGRPFKRHGWEILLSNEGISTYLGVSSCSILKCSYFELAGVDHIVIFTDAGVVFYNGGFVAQATDPDCYMGYDRCFFFEGDGTSAFYIYGNYRVWKYWYDTDFTLEEITEENLTIPRVIIGASADGTGTVYEGFNLFGTLARIEYNDTNLFTWWCSDDISIEVDSDALKTYLGSVDPSKPYYRWSWNGASWVDTNLTGKAFPSTQIVVHGTPFYDSETLQGDEIIVVYANGVMLPANATDINKIKAWATSSLQYDTELETIPFDETLATMKCKFWQDDTYNYSRGRAWIQFYDTWTEKVAGEDFIRVQFPNVNVSTTDFNDPTDPNLNDTGTANLLIEVTP